MARMNLKHTVITSVARDDLKDGSAIREFRPSSNKGSRAGLLGPLVNRLMLSRRCIPSIITLHTVYLQLAKLLGAVVVGRTCPTNRVVECILSGKIKNKARFVATVFELVWTEGPIQPGAAVKRERQLKKWTRAKKLALIRGEKAELKRLSQSRDSLINPFDAVE